MKAIYIKLIIIGIGLLMVYLMNKLLGNTGNSLRKKEEEEENRYAKETMKAWNIQGGNKNEQED